MFTDYSSIAQIAPGGNFFDSSSVNCDNPLLSAQQSATLGCTPAMIAAGDSVALYIARRNVEGGGRQQSFENSSFRSLLGVRGAITDTWDYDASVQYSKVKADQLTLNYFKKDCHLQVAERGNRPDHRRPGLRVGARRHGSELRALQRLPDRRRDAGRPELPAGPWHSDRLDRPVRLPGHHHRRPRQHRREEPLASEGIQVAFGAEYRKDQADQHDRQLAGDGAAVRLGWRDDRHRRRNGGHGPLHRSPRSDARRP